MAKDVTAVIMALRTILAEAETRQQESYWKVHIVNRWIAQLPGAWLGKWRHLKLCPDSYESAYRDNLISHVRATLAYLEAHQDRAVQSPSWWHAVKAVPTVDSVKPAPEDQSSADRSVALNTSQNWVH